MIHCVVMECPLSAVIATFSVKVKTACAQVFIRAQRTKLQGKQEGNGVIETTNMGESNGTNPKPVTPILFF
jgi:hypothetical protein